MSFQIRIADHADVPSLKPLLAPFDLDAMAFIDDPNDRLLLAVDDASARILGCLRLRSAIGRSLPRYWYHLGTRVHAAPDLGMFRIERTLLLGNDLTGESELTALAVASDGRDRGVERALVEAGVRRLRRERSGARRIIAPLPGPIDSDGRSPFWEGLGRAFFPGDPAQAFARFGESWVTHVAALLPKHPLVVSILPESTQQAIGAVDARAAVHRDALLQAGFVSGQHISVADGGPVYELPLELLDRLAPLGD